MQDKKISLVTGASSGLEEILLNFYVQKNILFMLLQEEKNY
tara:strand:+ start:5435 stop:5557 length:123 start_codon:yes stop_codon:yes gene_type:complete